MFEDYKKEVLKFYFEKKTAHLLPANLENPTPKRLKNETLKVYTRQYSIKDHEMLTSFFDPLCRTKDLFPIIERFDLDKFKPLINFLKEETNQPKEENVKLLAWLINFKTYQEWRQKDARIFPLTEEELLTSAGSNVPAELISLKGGLKNDLNETKNGSYKEQKDKRTASNDEDPSNIYKSKVTYFNIALTITILLMSVAFWFLNSSKKQCMFWAGNQYQKISCNEKAGNAPIIALDTFKLSNLKKNTRPDTLTKFSLGKVWYAKKDGKVEFFTSNGYHPLDNNRILHPLTIYMLNKYVLSKSPQITIK